MNTIKQKQEIAKNNFICELDRLLSTDNWGESLLKKVNNACNFSENYYLVLFKEGHEQILTELMSYYDNLMLTRLELDEKPSKIRERISKALFLRLTAITSKNVVAKLSSLSIIPSYIRTLSSAHFKTCDRIWCYAGDQSTDCNYYSKRGLLMTVYLSSIPFFINDNSENYYDTKYYIEESLNNIIKITSLKNKLNSFGVEQIPILRYFLS